MSGRSAKEFRRLQHEMSALVVRLDNLTSAHPHWAWGGIVVPTILAALAPGPLSYFLAAVAIVCALWLVRIAPWQRGAKVLMAAVIIGCGVVFEILVAPWIERVTFDSLVAAYEKAQERRKPPPTESGPPTMRATPTSPPPPTPTPLERRVDPLTPRESGRPTRLATKVPESPAAPVARKSEYLGVTLDSVASIGSYPLKWRIGTIEWRGLTDLRVNVTNPDSEAVANLDLVVATGPYMIFQMTQLSALANVVFPDDPTLRDKEFTVTGFDFKKIPIDSSGPNVGSTNRRILCERIPPGATLRVAMELASWPPQPPRGELRPVPDDIRSFTVRLMGSYTIGGEKRTVDSSLVVALGDELPKGDSVGAQKP